MTYGVFEVPGRSRKVLVTVFAKDRRHANYLATRGIYAEEPGDAGIVEPGYAPAIVVVCSADGCEQSARRTGSCHIHDREGRYQKGRSYGRW